MSEETQAVEVTVKDLPSLDLLYPLAIESYETARQRMITQDNRIQQIIVLKLAITGAILAIYQIFGISPNMPLLYIAGAFFLAGITLCLIAIAKNKLCTLDIDALFDDYLHVDVITAKASLIKYAGDDFIENSRYMRKRNTCLLLAMSSLAAEVMFFVAAALC